MSTKVVSKGKWWLAVSTLMVSVFSGGLLAFILASGYANPPREQHLILELSEPRMQTREADNLDFSRIDTLPVTPFTVEVSATFTGRAEWGIWLGETDSEIVPQWRFLIDDEGYVSAGLRNGLEWRQFIHADPDTNRLYLHVNTDHQVTFRINAEIAWEGQIALEGLEWGTLASDSHSIHWNEIRLFVN